MSTELVPLTTFEKPFKNIQKDHLILIDQYLDNLKRLNKSPHTLLNYRGDLLKFVHWLENQERKKLSEVNGELIGKYKEFLSEGGAVFKLVKDNPKLTFLLWFKLIFEKAILKKSEPLHLLFTQNSMSVSSRRRHLSSLKNFFQFLKEVNEDHNKKFSINPVKNKIHGITLKEIDVQSTKMISKEEFILIEEKCYRTKEKLMLYLLYYGGLRLNELRNLKVSSFNHKDKVITFARKGGSIHTLFIQKSDLIFKNLNFYTEKHTLIGDYLFQTKKGGPFSLKTTYNQIMKMITRVNVSAGISPHSFRKACATQLYIKTKDLLYVRDYLNHADGKVTQTYIDKSTLNQTKRRIQ